MNIGTVIGKRPSYLQKTLVENKTKQNETIKCSYIIFTDYFIKFNRSITKKRNIKLIVFFLNKLLKFQINWNNSEHWLIIVLNFIFTFDKI